MPRSSSSASCASTSVSSPRLAATSISRAVCAVVEVAQQEQHRVGARLLRRAQVLVGREEALGEERRRRRGAGGAEVVPGAAEALVDEHGDRSRAGAGVGGGDHGRVGIGTQVAGRGRAALDLGDRAEAGPGERVVEASHQAGSSAEKATSASRRLAAPRRSRSSRRRARAPSMKSSASPAATSAARRVQQHRVAPRRPARRRGRRG